MFRTYEGLGYSLRVWRSTCKNICGFGGERRGTVLWTIGDRYCVADYGKRAACKTRPAGLLRVSLASERLTSALFVRHTYGHIRIPGDRVYARYSFHSGAETSRRRAARAVKACHLRMRTARRAGIKCLAFPTLRLSFIVSWKMLWLEPDGIFVCRQPVRGPAIKTFRLKMRRIYNLFVLWYPYMYRVPFTFSPILVIISFGCFWNWLLNKNDLH